MTADQPCLVAQITPPGRSAIAVLLVHGPRAPECVGTLFRAASGRSLREVPIDRIALGHVRTGEDDCGEQVVVCRRGPATIEVQCHGGRAAAAQIVAALESLGYQDISWRDMALNLEDRAVTVEARTALAQARTERAAAVLLDQYNGSLQKAAEEIAGLLHTQNSAVAADELTTLLERSKLGLHLTESWQVVIAGRPNVGKSSLINGLLGYRRAIVYEQPGTTRDAVTATAAMDGWPVELIDTAGLRAGRDEVERAGVELARQRIDRADLVVFVSDASQPWCREDDALLESLTAPLLVHNKSDLPPAGGRPQGLATSALTGEGSDQLINTIGRRLVADPPEQSAAVPFTQRQIGLLSKALAAAEKGDARQAALLLECLV